MAPKNNIIKYRLWYIIIPVVITLIMLLPLRKAKIDPDLNAYLSDDIPAKVKLDTIEKSFGKTDPVLVIVEAPDILSRNTLERLKNLSKAFRNMSEFDYIISLFDIKDIRSESGMMIVEPAVDHIPGTEIEREELRERLRNNELAFRLVVSENFRYALIMLNPEEGIPDAEVIEIIREKLELIPGEEKVYINGMPYFRHEIQKIALRDLVILLPLGLLIMIILLYVSFGEKRGVLLPLSVVSMSLVIAMGLMPFLDWDYSIVAILVPILMIAVANNYGVHMISLYQELNGNDPGLSMKSIVHHILQRLSKPIILTALTTIIGILGLVTHIMLPAKQMGIVSAAGIAFALVFSLTFIPAVMSGMQKGKPSNIKKRKKETVVSRMLLWSGKVATRKTRPVILFFVVFFVLAGAGIFRLKVSINFENMMPRKHDLRTSTRIADQNFGGTRYVSLLFEGDIKDPQLLRRMDTYEQELEQEPEIRSVTSLATVIKLISRAMNDPGDHLYDTIPDSRAAVAQYIEFYMFSGDPDDFEQLVDFDYTKALMNIQFTARDMRTFNRITGKIRDLTASDPNFRVEAGNSLVEKQMSESIVTGQLNSLIFALAAILLLLAIIFRSPVAGLLGSLPLLFTLVCNFGLMGWLGIRLDIGTSLLSSIAIGIGVDYTIHLFWRLKSEIKQGKSHEQAVIHTLNTTGRGIAINAFSVITGFAVLFLSGITILKAFAFLIIFSLLLCLFCALTLVPALSIVLKPKFLYKNNNATNV
ncbi:MAG: MMPL family transporter [Bacteroidales bacterium]|nr:MMPL family transporter [Bacteroidales bacterium]